MRHAGRLTAGLIVCVLIAAVSIFVLINDLGPGDKSVDELGDVRPAEIELLPIPAVARPVGAGFGVVEPAEGLVDGRVYVVPSGFSPELVAEWYEREGLAGEPWGEQWTWCTTAEAGDGPRYLWVAPDADELLSLEVGRDGRRDSPAQGEVVVRLEIRALGSLADADRPAC